MKIQQENQQEISRWSRFKNGYMWKRIITELEGRLEEADAIVNMIGGDHKPEFSKRDLALMQKKEIKALMELPQYNIDLLLGTGEERVEEMDAFEESGLPDDGMIEDPED